MSTEDEWHDVSYKHKKPEPVARGRGRAGYVQYVPREQRRPGDGRGHGPSADHQQPHNAAVKTPVTSTTASHVPKQQPSSASVSTPPAVSVKPVQAAVPAEQQPALAAQRQPAEQTVQTVVPAEQQAQALQAEQLPAATPAQPAAQPAVNAWKQSPTDTACSNDDQFKCKY